MQVVLVRVHAEVLMDAIRADWRAGESLVAEMKKTFPPGSRPRRTRAA
jgi:hypothetical protein